MTEFDDFQATNEQKSEATRLSYRRQYVKLYKLAGVNIADVSQKKILELIYENATNPNQISSLTNIALLVRRMNNLPIDELVRDREKNKLVIEEHVKKANSQNKLPSLKELQDYTEYLYDEEKWGDYILNYLLLELQVRNKDLNFKIVTKKKEIIDDTINYIWLNYRHKKVVYVRNDYKTNETYGKKTNVLTEPKLLHALNKVLLCQKHDEDKGKLIKNEDHIGYYVKQATYKNIGEGQYLKVIINDARERSDTQMLTTISENRGTSVQELLKSYDVSKQ